MGKRKNKRRKEEIAEDRCFMCKDGGEMRVCDSKDCLKTYHAKNGKNEGDSDSYEIGEGEDVSDDSGSDCDLDYTAGFQSTRRKKRCMKKIKSVKGSKAAKDKKTDFVGWGSRSLMDFLKNIGRDTTKEYSELDVASVIIEYCHEKKLFDPKKRKRVICDANLSALLRRKSVNKNNIQNLLASHFAETVEETDDAISGSEQMDDVEAINFPKQRNLNPTTKSCQNVVLDELPSGFASIISSNLKLVYLKRSLIVELLKQPETFDGKVLGSFVRTKSDPNDYLQENSHLLLQVTGNLGQWSCNSTL
ncbi:unnamed protein product [Trifolium pratense]|uniref:Uncharacterized protein n=1 Tax=Trifolium pratense TaxID=57577 RepID=A0ACB0L2F4_TRIPR|nr:unnamed protein product [Trifolium pratense]